MCRPLTPFHAGMTLEQIRADILAVQKESEGLLAEILGGGGL